MSKAQDVVDLFEAEAGRAANFLNLWQETSEYESQMENAITTRQIDGQAQRVDLVDTTAVFDALDMASGLSSLMVPPGQPFFAVESDDTDANEDDDAKRWMSRATSKAHDCIWGSNFLVQFDEFLKSWVTFGEGALFSDFGKKLKLNYREYPAGSYHYQEDSERMPDVFLERFEYTAKQAVEEFKDRVPDDISKAAGDPKRATEKFEFVHVCRPRAERNTAFIDAVNMPYEEIFVEVKTKTIVRESGGFEDFPYHISRYAKSSKESRGRGVGVFVLPQVRSLNAMKFDFIECANRHNNPPKEVGPGVEGQVDVTPGALNHVATMGQIRAIEGALGNFPVTAELIASERQEIHRAFMGDTLNQLQNLQGDRRTTTEINERLREGLRRLAQPVGRLIAELMTPLITRSILLLIRNGQIAPPPPILQGKGIRIGYVSFLVLMLRQYQTQAFERWVAFVAGADQIFPGVKDNVDADSAIRDMADSFGVKAEHKRTIRSRDALRKQRSQDLATEQAAEAQAQLAQGYKQTTRAPEEGSLAEAVLNG